MVNLQSLRLSRWISKKKRGRGLMRLQASLSEDEPRQNVTLLLFDDVEIGNATEAENELAEEPLYNPMQAFYFQSGVDAMCPAAPDSGMLIQTPEGVGEVTFLINEVDISLARRCISTPRPRAL